MTKFRSDVNLSWSWSLESWPWPQEVMNCFFSDSPWSCVWNGPQCENILSRELVQCFYYILARDTYNKGWDWKYTPCKFVVSLFQLGPIRLNHDF